MNPSHDLESTLTDLTMREIKETLPSFVFSSAEKRSRAKMENAVRNLPVEQQALLEPVVLAKRRKTHVGGEREPINHFRSSSPGDEAAFLETVSQDCRNERVSKFIDATGNEATAMTTCAVCAGSFFNKEIIEEKVSVLHAKNKLSPSKPHPAQALTYGMLLHNTPSSLYANEHGVLLAKVCNSCMSSLRRDKTPSLSLANGMWIGDIPLELKVLTFAERLLVARHFPAAYVFKLHPKKKGSRHWDTAGFHSGLRGNVSTYRLNSEDIAHMTGDNIMPPPSAILAATIGVTFVGPKNLPQRMLPGFFLINRARVHAALVWLKQNNSLYSDILISSERLNALPVNGVPDEITSLAKISDDTVLLAEETDGYVPTDVSEQDGRYLL
jgi:hypothetical protein